MAMKKYVFFSIHESHVMRKKREVARICLIVQNKDVDPLCSCHLAAVQLPLLTLPVLHPPPLSPLFYASFLRFCNFPGLFSP